ncbi:hypothetical protein ATE84_4917 [Aquimarina sp. MAR_2010_214]|uniref:hypothetical protein n=1 Tax=Aquimarina sp. MAR_2010_214 TaxID=1250026 RepID=UPI000C6FE14F|nr:hypothetical protein [Aquimarina sp. MAR_2010_214]PKV52790.1 hypothetical protein ATE84_4917 [Aquimarina sp. MAR_2010_214]
MKTYILLLASVIQLSSFSQTKISGKTKYFASYKYNLSVLDSLVKKELSILNSAKHTIEIKQGSKTYNTQTDSKGFFEMLLDSEEQIFIKVNKESKVSNFNFIIEPHKFNRLIELNMTNTRVESHIDSITSTKFYNKYNLGQAYKNFENKNYKLIIIEKPNTSKQIIKRRRRKEKRHNVKYVPEDINSVAELRMMIKYNSKMKELIGI